MRVAAIDIGTNSVLLLIADVDAERVAVHSDHATITRLGEGLDGSGRLSAAAITRTSVALERYARLVEAAQIERVAAVATSAVRDAADAERFLERAQRCLGVRPQVLSGPEEAALGFDGALLGLPLTGPTIGVCDLGGGSTEVMLGAALPGGPPGLDRAVSLDIGCVRLTERYLHHDLPRPQELAAVRAHVRRAAAAAPPLAAPGRPWVALGGTATTLAALIHDIYPYDAERIHGCQLTREQVHATLTLLGGQPLAARRQLPALESGRADVIVAGAVILDEICGLAEVDAVTVSDRGLRYGLARRLAQP